MTPTKMASLFDVDFESSLDSGDGASDYSVAASEKKIRNFDDVCKDVAVVLEPVAVQEKPIEKVTDAEIVSRAIKNAKKSSVKREVENIKKGEVAESLNNKEKKPDIVPSPSVAPQAEERALEIPGDKKTEEIVSAPAILLNDNPLELEGQDLKAYHQILEKYPRFRLYNGNRAFRNFYCYKLLCLKTMLMRFPLLDLSSMSKELHEVNLDHFIDKDIIYPDLIRVKLNESYKCRVRITFLLVDAFGQFFAWKRWIEMLKSKLWKDQDIRGAHNRDGLTIEHLYDIEQYVADMDGFIESAKHVDNMLKAAADSLSRQLTCLQLKEHHAVPEHQDVCVNREIAERVSPTQQTYTEKQLPKTGLISDGLDSIDSGTIIESPKSIGALHPCDFGGIESDEIAKLGL